MLWMMMPTCVPDEMIAVCFYFDESIYTNVFPDRALPYEAALDECFYLMYYKVFQYIIYYTEPSAICSS